jgi:pimeloyl-ACP methyl ester carboxylesterase
MARPPNVSERNPFHSLLRLAVVEADSDASESRHWVRSRGYRCIGHDRRGHGRSSVAKAVLIGAMIRVGGG